MSGVVLDSADAKVLEEASGFAWTAYPEYKDSGAEWPKLAPSHWAVKRLRFTVKTNPTKSEVKGYDPLTEVSFVPMEAVGEYGGLNLEGQKVLEEVAAGYTYFRDGDVLVAKITPCFENGKGALAENLLNGIGFGTTELHVVRPAKGQLDSRFLFYLSISHSFRKFGEAEMYGAGGQKRIPEDFIKDFRAFLPPFPEQSAIASFLDRETACIDALIAKKQRLIELLQEKRTALISQAVAKGLDPGVPMKDSGVEWLGKIPAHWKATKLKFETKKIVDGTHFTPTYVDEGVPFLRVTDIHTGKIDWTSVKRIPLEEHKDLVKRCKPKRNDLLLSKNGTIGVPCVVDWDEEFSIFVSLCLLKFKNRLKVYYAKYFFLSHQISEQISCGSKKNTVTNLHLDKIKEFVFSLPPADEQDEIVRYLNINTSKLNKLIDRIASGIGNMVEYRSALISAAVTGKIDVR